MVSNKHWRFQAVLAAGVTSIATLEMRDLAVFSFELVAIGDIGGHVKRPLMHNSCLG